jgi:ABC-type transport system involved in cytochrome bd biosynthesis fused ATPase/permease subunit
MAHIFTYVPQGPKLRNRPLIDNITYDGATATVEEVDTLLRKAGP